MTNLPSLSNVLREPESLRWVSTFHGSISSTFNKQLLSAQIPKGQKDTDFWDLLLYKLWVTCWWNRPVTISYLFYFQVQLNIQPHNDDGHQKINIVDVLKVEPEISTVENRRRASVANDELSSDNFDDDEDDEFFNEDEDVDIEDVAPESVVDHPVSNFVESVEFCQLRKRFKYPNSVSEWTRMHTVHWAKWVNRTFKGVRLNEENW